MTPTDIKTRINEVKAQIDITDTDELWEELYNLQDALIDAQMEERAAVAAAHVPDEQALADSDRIAAINRENKTKMKQFKLDPRAIADKIAAHKRTCTSENCPTH